MINCLFHRLCERRENIHEKRKMAVENLQAQASKMTKFSLDKFPPGKVGDTVRVRVPDVDRGRCDLRNILGVVTHVNHDNKTYKIGTQFGRINSSYARNQFTTCKEKLMQLENVPDMEISLRECASKLSLSGGQGYKRRSCKTQCSSNRCTCRKSRSVMEVFLVQISNYANFFYVSILRLQLYIYIYMYHECYVVLFLSFFMKPYMGMV